MAALTSSPRDTVNASDRLQIRRLQPQVEAIAYGTERLTILRIKQYYYPRADGSDRLTQSKITIGPTTPVRDTLNTSDRVVVRRIKTYPHPGATGYDYGESKSGGWLYIQSDTSNGSDFNLIVKVLASRYGLFRDQLNLSDRLIVNFTGGNTWQNLSVWTGSVEVSVQNISVWDGSVEIPVSSYLVT